MYLTETCHKQAKNPRYVFKGYMPPSKNTPKRPKWPKCQKTLKDTFLHPDTKTNSLIITSPHLNLCEPQKKHLPLLTVKETTTTTTTTTPPGAPSKPKTPPLLPTGIHKFSGTGPRYWMPKVPSLRHCFEHFDPPRSPVARIDDRGGTPFWGGDRSVFSWGFVLNVFWGGKGKGGRKNLMIWVASWVFFSDILEDFRVSDLCFPFNYGNAWCPFWTIEPSPFFRLGGNNNILLMQEIPNNHLGCHKPCN